MANNVISTVSLDNMGLAIWFDGGTSKRYDATELGIQNEDQLQSLVVLPDGSGITWDTGAVLSADELMDRGEVADFVEEEKLRLLKGLSGIRRDAEFSQTRLGEAAGIRQSVISRIEGCEISPQINTLLKLLAPLGKTLSIVDLK